VRATEALLKPALCSKSWLRFASRWKTRYTEPWLTWSGVGGRCGKWSFCTNSREKKKSILFSILLLYPSVFVKERCKHGTVLVAIRLLCCCWSMNGRAQRGGAWRLAAGEIAVWPRYKSTGKQAEKWHWEKIDTEARNFPNSYLSVKVCAETAKRGLEMEPGSTEGSRRGRKAFALPKAARRDAGAGQQQVWPTDDADELCPGTKQRGSSRGVLQPAPAERPCSGAGQRQAAVLRKIGKLQKFWLRIFFVGLH